MTRHLTPAQRHLQRHTAATLQAQAEAAQPERAHATAYELQLMQLAEDRRRLKDIQSIERKIELKAQLLPAYDAWIDGTLQADHGAQDEVLTTLLVWHIDCANYVRALDIAEYALRHNLVLPDRYERSLACVVAEEIADAQLKAHDAGKPINYHVVHLAVVFTEAHDMPDEVRAKLIKARGIALLNLMGDNKDGLENALADFRRAHTLHDKSGVKKLIETTERTLKKMQAAATPAPAQPSEPREPEAGGPSDTQNSQTPSPTSTPAPGEIQAGSGE